MKKETKIVPNPKVWSNVLKKMLSSGEYDFAEEFLEDVLEQIQEEDFITTKQTTAIQNIRRRGLVLMDKRFLVRNFCKKTGLDNQKLFPSQPQGYSPEDPLETVLSDFVDYLEDQGLIENGFQGGSFWILVHRIHALYKKVYAQHGLKFTPVNLSSRKLKPMTLRHVIRGVLYEQVSHLTYEEIGHAEALFSNKKPLNHSTIINSRKVFVQLRSKDPELVASVEKTIENIFNP